MYAFGKVLQEQVTIQNDSLKENQFVDLAKKRPILNFILDCSRNWWDYKKNGIEKNVNTLGNASKIMMEQFRTTNGYWLLLG
jgi:hypothetical protein